MKLPDDFDSAAAKVAGQLSTDPIDRAAGEVVAAQKVQAKTSLYSALLQSPEMAARAQKLGRRTGLPADVVSRNLPEVERSAYLSDIDKMLDANPAVVQFLTSPQYAAMAHDDVENMGQVERKLRQFGGGATEGVGMAVSGTGRIMDIVQRNVLQGLSSILLPTPKAGPMGITPQAPTAESLTGPMIGDGWRELGGTIKDFARKELMIPQAAQTFGDKVAAGLGQVAGQVAMFPLDRGASMFAQGADVMGEKVDKDPASQGRKDLAVLGGAAVTGITERWALDKLLGPLAVPVKNQIGAAMARIGIASASEGAQEFTENVLQDTLRKALTNRDAEINIGQSIEEGGVGAAVGGIVRTIVEGALHIRVRGAQAQVAQQDAQAITELTQLAQASKLAQRDPATFQEFVRQAAQDGPVQEVYIDAKTFAQAAQAAGLQPEQLPASVREQLGDALATGGSVRIPIEEYAAQIATTEYAQGLIDHLKTDPLGMSRAEAQVFMQSQLGDLQASVEKALAERESDASFKAEIDQVRAGFTEQLAQANRFTPDVNTAYANMLANFYAVTAAKAGMTPQQLVERYPLRVQAEGVQGAAAQYDQAVTFQGLTREQFLGEPKITKNANAADLKPRAYESVSAAEAVPFLDGKFTAKFSEDGAAVFDGEQLIASYNNGETLVVDKKHRRQGIGEELVYQWRTRYPAPAKATTRTRASQAIQEKVWKRIQQEQQQVLNQAAAQSRLEQMQAKAQAEYDAVVAQYQGTEQWLRAPNGNQTKLTERQWVQVRTPSFKAWFGDWEKFAGVQGGVWSDTQKEVSKVVDDNGEPLVVYHGTDTGGFTRFMDTGGQVRGNLGIFTTSNRAMAQTYVKRGRAKDIEFGQVTDEDLDAPRPSDAVSGIYAAFVNLRDVYETDFDGAVWNGERPGQYQVRAENGDLIESDSGSYYFELFDDANQAALANPGSEVEPADSHFETTDEAVREARKNGNDGAIIRRVQDDGGGAGPYAGEPSDVFVAFDPGSIKSADQNIGTFGASTDNILFQSGRDQIDSLGFGLWSHGHPVVKIDEGHTFKSGEGVVVEALHGTTGDFDTFEQERANIESDLGGGFYFTNALGDVGENYAGMGPDLTNKIERVAEQIASETDREYNDPDVVAEARSQFMANEGLTMPVFVRFDNPVVLGGSGETFLDYEEPYDDETEEYGEPQGKLVDFDEALRDAASEFSDADADTAMADVWESVSDEGGIGVSDLIAKLKASEGLAYATDENGVLASTEIIRRAFAGIGFDGFIDTTVNRKFGSEKDVGKPMAGMDEDTVHFIAFNPNQVASRIGSTWTRENPGDSILKQGTGNRGQIAFGQDITQVPSIITLMKGADLSTFLHESGHFFLEVQFDLASRVAGEAAMFGSDTNNEAQRQLLNDTSELLRWFGLSSIEEWYALPMEQKRSYHEQFARGFEAYLFEGKAPSIELQGLFQRFRAWLMRVYRDLKALNVELTDEVRGVMDRMLATTEQIQLAEQGRSMMPLFTAPEQAGMSVEEFAAYQDLGTQASQDAIEELQTRTLRDMQWMERAKGREIKRLKRESADRRAEMTIEARREVMSQPVYRAWQFLTGKLSKDDKAAMTPEAAPKSTTGPVDPSVDSLFVAIAKLGGLDRAEVQSQWGWDAKERSPQPMFGKPLLRRENGVSLDAMGELLAEYGYLPKDENGKFDARDLEDKFQAEYRGDAQFSVEYEYARAVRGEQRPGEGTDLENLGAGRFDLVALKDIGLPEQAVQIMVDLKMTAKDGIHPDLVAEAFGFTSGDELVRTLAVAEAPKVAIEQLTDQKMLEKYGELATPEAIERAAEQAIHNDTRARFVATELNALAKATGQPKVLASAAREMAKTMIERLLVRNVKPTQYAAAEVRAAKAAEQAVKSGDTETAAAEKRNQLINTYATRSAINALADVEQGLRYLGKFGNEGTRKAIDVDYLDQIDTILERFDLRTGQSLRSIDRRKSLAKWMAEQEELGIEVDLPEKLTAEAFRQSYKDMTIEEFRGLVDSVKQIEHLGRLKETLLTAADNRRFADVVGEITRSVEENADGREVNNRTRDTLGNRAINFFKGVLAEHRKVASLARELDGFKDAGPVWRYLIDSMNTSGDREASMRAEATFRLAQMVKPVLAQGRMGGKGQFFASLGMSLNRSEQLAIALNLGNEGNTQRLLDGKGWTLEQVLPVMRNLTAADWQFVQQVWDFFESYRPQIGAMERRISGKEPAWVEPRPLTVQTKDGQEVQLRGGYYPIVYDPAESGRAEQFADAEAAKQMMKGAFVASTTRSSFIKGRAEKVTGRPVMLTWDALFRGANDVIHRLAWQEWVIDANRLIKNDSVDEAIRTGYGAETVKQFKNAIRDIAAGENAQVDTLSKGLNYVRSGAAVAGLGLNLMNAMLQPLGLSQSMVRVGTRWVAMGAAEWAKSPVGLVRQVHEKSEFMRNRSRTQQRELNEIRSVVQGKSEVQQKLDAIMFMPMTSLQLIADMPTWWGAYQKALAQAPVDMDAELVEERAVKLADQSVIDAQGGGQTKDLAAVQRSQLLKLFTVFYGYFSTTYNLGVERAKATNFRSPLEVMHLAWDYLLLFSAPAVLATIMKSALTPGGEEDDPEKLAKKLASEQISYLMGMMIGVREATSFVQGITGTSQYGGGYSGPAGLRFFSDLGKLGKQVSQGELDEALRRSLVNVGGVLLHLPSGQVNKTLDGINALNEGKTDNPAALLFGVER